ncbi:unnamed protein product, partial [Callosobruchus maculatus]
MEDFDFFWMMMMRKLSISWNVEYGIPRRIYHMPNYFEELDEFFQKVNFNT